MAITCDILKPEAKIFQELKKNPSCWARFKNDSSLYIEIRKDNQVNVYFAGGSVARIHYCSKHKKLQVFTHHKYLNLPAASKSNAYIECSGIIDEPKETNSEILVCDKVIERVKTCYSQKHAINGIVDKEKWSEKFIQGTLITQSSDFHLDSEFAYNDATDKNRIDLIRCDKGVITFVELKRIADGTHKAPSMKVAEAAKAIENTQRDINISFMNELALIFDRIGIDTNDVIEAAGTKWNFRKYRPGLVGGHCISVDPYYLAHKAKSLGYEPEVILSGRRVNNNIAQFIAQRTLKLMIQADHKIKNSNVLILGITFKENCPDMRNTKVVDIYKELLDFGVNVDIYDPMADKHAVKEEFRSEEHTSELQSPDHL